MSDLTIRPYNEGLSRAADSLLRSQGGFAVGLRLPSACCTGSGRGAARIERTTVSGPALSPAVFRKARIAMAEGQRLANMKYAAFALCGGQAQ